MSEACEDRSNASPRFRWTPTERQAAFLESKAYEALYGGAAGGGKSEALLVGALRWVSNPNFRGLILRRTFADLERSLIERSRALYKAAVPEAEYNEMHRRWRFPSGAVIYFGHLDTEAAKYNYQSAEFSYVAFDELTHFTETQYTYLLSRARSAHGLPIRIRSATNPGGDGHEWVMRRWGPWLDVSHDARAKPGEVRWYRNTESGIAWCDRGQKGALSRVFFPAKLSDNPHLANNDPDYVERLKGLDRVTRGQLLDGDWLVRRGEGLLFKRDWFEIVDAIPSSSPIVSRARYWDRAATAEADAQRAGRDSDYTAGVLVSANRDGILFVEDVARFRGSPKEVMATVLTLASLDGRGTQIGLEREPGSSGKFEIEAYLDALRGFSARGVQADRDKVTRARIPSAQAERGRIKLLRGRWNDAFLDELEEFPEGAHDDQVDAFSGAFGMVETPRPHLRDVDRWMPLMPKARWANVGAKREPRKPLTAPPHVTGLHPYRRGR